jgi:predicted glycogen debranching enzyme
VKPKKKIMLKKEKNFLQNHNKAIQNEWLETNGLGGWSSSSIIGCNTRRYHGLLVAATKPPTERTVLLSKLDETIVSNNERFELGVNDYGEVINPKGNQFLKSFTKELFPQWIYEVSGIQIKKTIAMLHGENTVVIVYDVLKASKSFTLELLPLMAGRFYHSMNQAGPQMHWDVDFKNGQFHNKPDGKLDVYVHVPGTSYQHDPRWFKNFNYAVEKYRGQDFTEDLFNHGIFSVGLKKGDSLGIIISTENTTGRDAHDLLAKESLRRQLLLNDQPGDETLQALILAADQFIVRRNIESSKSSKVPYTGRDLGEAGATVIAGYHWFTDWGRDTMISLPGLCLSTGRFEDAKKILAAFANSVSQGMLPNRFQDNGEEPEYNNVDGTLWYFIAVYKYLKATNDNKFVLKEILPVLKDIIEWHQKGTRYNIHETEEGLLYSGEDGFQLTWMDAKVGDWVVTPRRGMAVEIQALWYNAQVIYADLLEKNNENIEAKLITGKAAKTKTNFLQQFWNDESKYLYDVVNGEEKDKSIRPNQLFAISLPYALIDGKQAAAVLKIVEEKLYTPVGLRTLPKDDDRYVGIYGGDAWHRDSAYHQGTVWSWLLGPYIDAVMKVESKKSKVKKIMDAFKYHLNEGCIGSVSEIFDADVSHHPRGCIAQAWGVAELLRVMKEYELFDKKKLIKKDKIKMPVEA